MATITRPPQEGSDSLGDSVIVLDHVTWDTYESLRDNEDNYHIRMQYDNGRLELMSPSFKHEGGSRQLADFVRMVTVGLKTPCRGAGSLTLKKKGKGLRRGVGKEPDSCFFLANEPRMRGKKSYTPGVDPPPDLAIEVEISYRSESILKIYAKLGVPEVWRYDGQRIWFGTLRNTGKYVACKESRCLPMITPEIVLGWLGRIDEIGETEGLLELMEWARDDLAPRLRARGKL